MRLPDFTRFTPDEKKAVLALLLLTGGGSLVIEAGRHQPRWTPDLKLVAEAGLRPGAAGEDSTGDDSTVVVAGGGAPAQVADAPPRVTSPLPPLLAAALASTPEVVAAGMTAAADPARAAAPGAAAPPATRAAPPPATADSARADGRVDVNHADLAALGTLPGIGPKMAERIVADRQANGLYRRVEDLLRVKGIGPAKLAKLRERVVIRR